MGKKQFMPADTKGLLFVLPSLEDGHAYLVSCDPFLSKEEAVGEIVEIIKKDKDE